MNFEPKGMATLHFSGNAMDHIYEVHVMEEGMPVIFHRDEVQTGCFCPTNWHENPEILCFTEGSGFLVCEDERTPVCAGEIGMIDSGLLHRVESDSELHYFCLIVDNDFCNRNGIHPECALFPRVSADETLRTLYNNVAEAYLSGDSFRGAAIRGEVLRLMVYLMRSLRLPGENVPQRSSKGVRFAIGYLRSHYREEIDLDRLSSLAGVSKYHFSREFKRITGHTVITYLNRIRIEQAARMIREENASASFAARATGFSSHSYFSKVFYRLHGMLPSAFAEQCRKTDAEKN